MYILKNNTIKLFFSNIVIIFLFSGCLFFQPIKTQSATIIFKTSNMKFYDKGFIVYYPNYINLQIFNVGNVVLNLKIYKTKICKDDFKCLYSKNFNTKYLSATYQDDFLYRLFQNKNINFKDKKNHILIKVIKDR